MCIPRILKLNFQMMLILFLFFELLRQQSFQIELKLKHTLLDTKSAAIKSVFIVTRLALIFNIKYQFTNCTMS